MAMDRQALARSLDAGRASTLNCFMTTADIAAMSAEVRDDDDIGPLFRNKYLINATAWANTCSAALTWCACVRKIDLLLSAAAIMSLDQVSIQIINSDFHRPSHQGRSGRGGGPRLRPIR